jgi:spore maturation protein CgeB
MGACDSDRANGILQLKRLGFDIKVIAKIAKYQSIEKIHDISKELDIEITPVFYKFDTKFPIQKLKGYILRFIRNPLVMDGSASEFDEPEIKNIFRKKLEKWKPDLVWFDTTYTWPLWDIARKKNIPLITRSLNFETKYFLEENGYNVINFIRAIPKLFGEIMAVRKSDFIFAINPKEEKIYKHLGAKKVETLPLRGLSTFLQKEREIKEKKPLRMFFMGSGYTVFHMRAAMKFILKEVMPKINKVAPGSFFFHILGKKLPKEFEDYFTDNITYEGFVEPERFDFLLEQMDIALVPSLYGAGMQQKIFEPLCRGIPTITSPRGLAGYPFKNGRDILLALTPDDFVKQLVKLQDINFRKKISNESLKTCNKLFLQERLDSIIISNIARITKKLC